MMLYVRMLITMVVGLFTSRILLQALGVIDYGLYNVIGGFVAMFTMISGSLSGAISRFITFELGTGDINKLKRIFATSILVQIGLGLIVILVAETIGLWFLYHKMVIPADRLFAAFWVFQLSVISFVINLLSIPYISCITSHEKMSAFAYISIYEVTCKLLICFAVLHSPIDRLIFYAILLFLVNVSLRIIYTWYCKRHFDECHTKLQFNKKLFKEMFGFAGWNFIGSAGWSLRTEGGTILFNLFGGPAANAANGIAGALCNAVTGFVGNFTTAFRPQITKTYAAKKFTELNMMLLYCSKISFYMMFILGLPVMLNTQFILHLWLGNVPEHSAVLVQLIIILSLSDTISNPLITAKLATGNIRNYQLVVGGIQLLAVPLAYVVLKLGAPVEFIYVSYLVTSVGCLVTRILMLRGDIPLLSIRKFTKDVVINVWIVAALSSVIPYLIYTQFEEGWIRLIVTSTVSVISCATVMFFIGLNNMERKKVSAIVLSYLKRKTQ